MLALGFVAAAGRVAAATVTAGPPSAASAPGTAPGASPADSSARIAAERSAVNARYAEQERECKRRFVVASCIEDAKRDRRQELDRLRTRQIVVDDSRRRERAAARRSELVAKAAEDSRREAERAARAASASASAGASNPARRSMVPLGRTRAAPAASGASASGDRQTTGAGLGIGAPATRLPGDRASDEARSRAEFAERQRRAAEHREESARQSLRRMAGKNPASPLPAPSAASVGRR